MVIYSTFQLLLANRVQSINMPFSNRQASLQNKTVFISCIIPVYNESAVIVAFIHKLYEQIVQLTTNFEIIIVDDGSSDTTAEQVLQSSLASVKLISLSRNFGKEVALTAGLDHCSGEVAILLDADFQHPIEKIAEFLLYWTQGYDMVYGARQDRIAESYMKRNLAHLFYWLMERSTEIDIPSDAGDFRLLDRKVIDALMQMPERSRFMKGLYAWVGFKKIAIPYEVQKRVGGKSGWNFTKLAELAITGMTSFSDLPLRVWSVVGFIISFISLIYAIYIVTVTLIYGADLPGFPTLIVAIMFLGGVQLLSIGILGEYIAGIFTEVKQRPKYLIAGKHGFDQ